jgi:hypothetical protein
MDGPNSTENKKSIIDNVVLLEPRLDGIGVDLSLYIAKHIHRMYKEAKQMAGLDTSEIEKSFLNKLISLKPRIKSIDSTIGAAELMFSLCEEVLDSSDTLTATPTSSSSLASPVVQSTAPQCPPELQQAACSAATSPTLTSLTATSSTATSSTATSSTATSSSLSAVASPATAPPAVTPPAVTPPTATQSTTPPQSTAQQGASSSPTPSQPVGPLYTFDQLNSSPYSLISPYAPVLDEHIPHEFTPLVGKYQIASDSALKAFIKCGGIDHHSHGVVYGSSKVQTLRYLCYHGKPQSMEVLPKRVKDHNRLGSYVPYILSSQYRELYNSMVHKDPSDWRNMLSEILVDL